MILCVAGSRGVTNKRRVYYLIERGIELANWHVTKLIHGDCQGVDKIAEEWAKLKGIEYQSFPAPWNNIKDKPLAEIRIKNGRKYWVKAGPERNAVMAEKADCFITVRQFYAPSRGTEGMQDLVIKTGKPYIFFAYMNKSTYRTIASNIER